MQYCLDNLGPMQLLHQISTFRGYLSTLFSIAFWKCSDGVVFVLGRFIHSSQVYHGAYYNEDSILWINK